MLNATTTAGAQLRNLVIIVICIALLAGINVVFNDYIVRVISTIFIFMILAVSYNLINGVTGQLSLEPNGFVAVGAYVAALLILSSDSKVDMFEMAAPSPWILSLHAGFLPALLISGLCAAALAVCLAVPVFRVRGDYLAIVTLAFGEIIKDLINCLLVGWDENGLHIALNVDGTKSMSSLGLSENGIEIIKGAQGATGNARIATFAMGFALVMITLVVVLNLVRSRTGRAIMAIRDNRIAAESVGINVTKYKLIAFVTSASLAGAAGALFGLNYSNVTAVQFDFNTSILVLVYVVLGGLLPNQYLQKIVLSMTNLCLNSFRL